MLPPGVPTLSPLLELSQIIIKIIRCQLLVDPGRILTIPLEEEVEEAMSATIAMKLVTCLETVPKKGSPMIEEAQEDLPEVITVETTLEMTEMKVETQEERMITMEEVVVGTNQKATNLLNLQLLTGENPRRMKLQNHQEDGEAMTLDNHLINRLLLILAVDGELLNLTLEDGAARLLSEMMEELPGETTLVEEEMITLAAGAITPWNKKTEEAHQPGLRGLMMTIDLVAEAAEVEVVPVAGQVETPELASNAMKKATWPRTAPILLPETTEEKAEVAVEAVEPASSANKKVIWLENALILTLEEEMTEEEEVEAEEEAPVVVVAAEETATATNVEKAVTLPENALKKEAMREVRDPTRDRGETMEALTAETLIMMTTTREVVMLAAGLVETMTPIPIMKAGELLVEAPQVGTSRLSHQHLRMKEAGEALAVSPNHSKKKVGTLIKRMKLEDGEYSLTR